MLIKRWDELKDEPTPQMNPVFRPIIYDDRPVKTQGDALGTVFWQGRQWSVTDYGLEARSGQYPIEAKRLKECWIPDMAEKGWVDMDDFITAFAMARMIHGVSDRVVYSYDEMKS